MECPKCGNPYHPDHGCGTAVMCGTAYAEHILSGCSFYPQMQGSRITGGFFKPNDGNQYPRWECPANREMCPWCWHKENDNREKTELSEAGQEFKSKVG